MSLVFPLNLEISEHPRMAHTVCPIFMIVDHTYSVSHIHDSWSYSVSNIYVSWSMSWQVLVRVRMPVFLISLKITPMINQFISIKGLIWGSRWCDELKIPIGNKFCYCRGVWGVVQKTRYHGRVWRHSWGYQVTPSSGHVWMWPSGSSGQSESSVSQLKMLMTLFKVLR